MLYIDSLLWDTRFRMHKSAFLLHKHGFLSIFRIAALYVSNVTFGDCLYWTLQLASDLLQLLPVV